MTHEAGFYGQSGAMARDVLERQNLPQKPKKD
jgi:hypothetical protein